MNESTEGQLIAIDGKMLRSSYVSGDRQSTIRMVNGFACANKGYLARLRLDRSQTKLQRSSSLFSYLMFKEHWFQLTLWVARPVLLRESLSMVVITC